jgi:predicted anti-sigma-YlaC factor YlaD
MHNCKATRELFTELLLDGVDHQPDKSLVTELNACPECFEEFGSVKETAASHPQVDRESRRR